MKTLTYALAGLVVCSTLCHAALQAPLPPQAPPCSTCSQCDCTSPADCTCDGVCCCPGCADYKWVRFADNDPRYAVLTYKGRHVGTYIFDGERYQQFLGDGMYASACKPPMKPPESIADVKAWPAAQPTVVKQPSYAPPAFEPYGYDRSFAPMMSAPSASCGPGG